MIAGPPSEGVTQRLILIRHGEPDESLRGRCYGRIDADLSPRGRSQLTQTSRSIHTPLAAVYSSPRRRALQSAAIVAAGRTRVTVHDDLRELDFGRLEGLTYAAIAAQYPSLFSAWMTAPTAVAFPDGERFGEMASRVRAAIVSIRSNHPSGSIAIVSHGGVNRIALAEAIGLPLDCIFRIDQGYGCMNVVDYYGDTPLARLINAVPVAC